MSRERTWLIVLAAAAAVGLGFARLPDSREDGDRRPLLVTSALGARSAILFVLDPVTRNLAAYEATPGDGTPGSAAAAGGLRLLGARKIEHDLELAEYRDLSEFSYSKLREMKNGSHGQDTEKKTSGDH